MPVTNKLRYLIQVFNLDEYIYAYLYIFICVSGLKYFLTAKNSLCLETKDLAVEDLQSCKEAVDVIKTDIPEAHFEMTEDDAHFPKGCYLYNNVNVYFNKHSSGSSHARSRQICKANILMKGKYWNNLLTLFDCYIIQIETWNNSFSYQLLRMQCERWCWWWEGARYLWCRPALLRWWLLQW